MHIARDDIHNPQLIYANFYVADNASVETTVGTGTIKSAIEYPSGTIVPCGSVSFPNGLTTISCTIDIPNGATFWTRELQTNTNGTPITANTGFVSTDWFINGTGTPSDFVNSGSFAASSGNTFSPIAIVAMTSKPTVAIHGDSRAYGAEESATDANGDTGDVARSIGPSFGYTKYTTNGALLSGYLSSHTYRSQLMVYYSHIIDEYGFNDRTAGQSAATVAANRATFAALYPTDIVIGTTLYNQTSSTDNWVTLVNQTVHANDPQSLDTLIKAGIVGERFVFDVQAGLDPTATGKFPVNGTTFYSTPDGLHVNNTGSLIIKNSGVVNTSLVVR